MNLEAGVLSSIFGRLAHFLGVGGERNVLFVLHLEHQKTNLAILQLV